MFWLMTFVGKWTSSALMGAVPWLLVCLAFALYFGLFAWLARKAWALGAPWMIPITWAAVEIFRSKIPYLFYPWSLNGASLFKLPMLLQSAQWLGEFFVGAWIVAIATLVVMLFHRDEFPPRRVWPFVTATLLVLLFSVASYQRPVEGRTLTVAAAQPGVDLAFTPIGQQAALLAAKVPEALSVGAGRYRDLTVLPEGIGRWGSGSTQPAMPFDLPDIGNVVIGGQRSDEAASYQGAFGFDGETWSHADKTRLVIFGEYVPFRSSLPFLDAFGLPDTDLAPGREVGTLTLGDLKVGPVLCFEALFEEVSRISAGRGADVHAVMSIDDWYQGPGAIDARIGGAGMRAIENGLPVVRSASLGPSAIIDARGNIVAFAETGKTTTIFAEVTSVGTQTTSLRLAIMVVACVATVGLAFWRKRSG
jgi:apolipoprotein N-acyltransferase